MRPPAPSHPDHAGVTGPAPAPRAIPTTMRRAVPLAFFAVLVLPAMSSADTLSDLTEPFARALSSGSYGLALGLIFIAGLATSLTPCVYPMIAITVSVFGARKAKSRTEGALLSLAFVLGIAALFTPLGIISALTGSAMGAANSSPYVMVPLALLFLAMAASMFGAFDMNLPSGLSTRLAQVGGSGYKGAFLIGFVNGIIAAPCTGPVLTVLLSWVATSHDVAFGGLSLFVYSLGLGVLFFVVGTFAVSLPKSGRWLDGVKSVFGVVMIVLALFYLSRFVSLPIPAVRSTPWLIGSAVTLAVGLAIGAIHLSFKDGPTSERVRKGLGVTLSVAGALSLVMYLSALPPGAHITWREDIVAARTEASERGLPLLVDFGADWCGACKELEHGAMSDPRVIAEARRFVTLRVDLSASKVTPEKNAVLRSYGQPGLPLVVMHNADGTESSRITGLVSADAFLAQLRAAR